MHPGYGGLIINADFTHSIVGMSLLSAVLGLATCRFRPEAAYQSPQERPLARKEANGHVGAAAGVIDYPTTYN